MVRLRKEFIKNVATRKTFQIIISQAESYLPCWYIGQIDVVGSNRSQAGQNLGERSHNQIFPMSENN